MNTNKVSYQFPEHVPANIAARAYVEEEGTEGDMRHYLNAKRALEESGGDVYIPRKMADRLLSLEEVAARLGCGKQLVTLRMARGEIIWTVEAGTGDRKVKKSRLDEYIRDLPEYKGRKCDALPVAV